MNSFLLYKNSTCHTSVKRYDQFRFHLEIGHALIGGYSSRKHKYSRSNTDTQANNAVNVNTHENVHMNAKCVDVFSTPNWTQI